jgi:ATP-binding cassette, subfamily F, member 3
MLFQINQGAKSFGTTDVFENLNFEVKEKEKIAIVGRNGAGKTTLLKVIDGQIPLDHGTLNCAKSTVIGYLSQIVFKDEQQIVRNELQQAFNVVLNIKYELELLAAQLEYNHEERILKRYADLMHHFELAGGYTIDVEIDSMVQHFGFSVADLDRPISSFSGGQKTKLAFIKLLLTKPDILLLDEPTNHLDIATIEWLENYLKNYQKAIIMVSHDRLFLQRVCNVTYEIELGRGTRYGGNYEFYQHAKQQALALELKIYKNQQAEIERLEQLIEKFRYKKDKAAFAQSKIKYLDRMDKVELSVTDNKAFKADFDIITKGGKTVLTMEQLTIGYDRPLAQISLEILRGQRLAIIGPNGCGKSTLLKTLAGRINQLGGHFLFGHQIKFGYFDQELAILDKSNNVIEELWAAFPQLTRTQVRTILGNFLFSSDDVFKSVGVLSGGEKVRLAFSKLMLEKANCLLLDEPTNNLDIISKEALERALLEYEGTILLVSHDRYFIHQLANALLVYEHGKFVYYPHTYQEYLDKQTSVVNAPAPTVAKVSTAAKDRNDQKLLAKLEKQIIQLEQAIDEWEEKLFDEEICTDYLALNRVERSIEDLKDELRIVSNQWEELMDSLE